jgi:hypothetical protein
MHGMIHAGDCRGHQDHPSACGTVPQHGESSTTSCWIVNQVPGLSCGPSGSCTKNKAALAAPSRSLYIRTLLPRCCNTFAAHPRPRPGQASRTQQSEPRALSTIYLCATIDPPPRLLCPLPPPSSTLCASTPPSSSLGLRWATRVLLAQANSRLRTWRADGALAARDLMNLGTPAETTLSAPVTTGFGAWCGTRGDRSAISIQVKRHWRR